MTVRVVAIPLFAVLLLTSCTSVDIDKERDLNRYVNGTAKLSKEFSYEEHAEDRQVLVTGSIEDDLRFQAKLNVQGGDVVEEVASDDALAVRIIDPTKVPELATATIAPPITQALGSGRWVLDPQGAPPPVPKITKAGSIEVGKNYVLDSIYAFEYFRRSISEGITVVEFNPDDPEYRPQEDPFPRPNKEAGILRFDVVAPPLPRRSARGTEAALPTQVHFRKMAFYVRDKTVLEVREQIDYESHRDFIRARQGTGPKYPLELLDAVKAGKTREPIRTRLLLYKVLSPGKKVTVTLPGDAVTGHLRGLFGQEPGQEQTAPSQTE